MSRTAVVLAMATGGCLLGSAAAFAECSPTKLVKITTANVSPAVPADSFARKPKVMYRLGNGKVRLEEQHDPDQNVQLLIISDAPVSWQIDLVSKSGQKAVDTAKSKEVHVPIFSDEGLPEEIMSLEFGCEHDFIAHKDTQHERKETRSGAGMTHYVRSGPWKATLLMRGDSDHIVAAILSRDGTVVSTIRYLRYEQLEDAPAGLFAPPPDVRFEEDTGSTST